MKSSVDAAKLVDQVSALVDAARKAGADAADAVVVRGRSSGVTVRLGKVEATQASESDDIALRVFVGKRVASVSATASSDAMTLAQRAVAMARVSPEDPFQGLADPSRLATTIKDLDLLDQSEISAERLKEDAMAAAAAPKQASQPASAPSTAVTFASMSTPAVAQAQMRAPSIANDAAREERVPMSRLRQTIARRLKDAQNTAAMLTTYNEVDMTNVMALRNEYKDVFEKKHGVKLGFMSFFTKACCVALKDVPEVNAEIDGTDIVYKNFVHMGIAVGTPSGLVVPVVRDADQMSFAAIEKKINELGARARDGKLSMAEMQGGTFTISNGGVYGSLMSSPILNPPQSGILGMHKIQERPMVVKGQIVARPMMYLALSYDHRIVDGKGAVTFLVRVKEALEDPRRMLMDL